MPEIGELVIAWWSDACTYGGWQEDDGRPFTPSLCVSAGWVVQVDEQCICLSPHTQEDNSKETMGDVMVIPRGMLDEWQRLKPHGKIHGRA